MNQLEPVEIVCPYCGESIEMVIDCSILFQSYIEDCQICCRPINVDVQIDDSGSPEVVVRNENEA